MLSLRGSLSNLNTSVTNLIRGDCLGAQSMQPESFSSPSSISGDDSSDRSHAIPNFVIKEQWQVILGQDASLSDLKNAIDRCKELVIETEECSSERKWLVRHLVELRFRVRELQDLVDDPQSSGPTSNVILGHHFNARQIKNIPTSKQYCDHCSGIIWSVVQASYICSDCSYCVHHKCLKNILRVCAHVIASERKFPIADICPEVGLALQSYKCAECHTPLNFRSSWVEPRLCDYTGFYYCPTCHWNNTSIIPARVVHNWDFVPRKIGRASLQEYNILYEKAVINLEEKNPKLFVFVQKLCVVKKLREYLCHMRKYLVECRLATNEKLLESNIGTKRHLIQYPEMYSLADLVAVENETMAEFLNKLFDLFEKHIRNCEICYGKGYHCEICGNNEIVFPFDDAAIPCRKCNSIYHRVCWIRKNMNCVKCKRLENRKSQSSAANPDEDQNPDDVKNNDQ